MFFLNRDNIIIVKTDDGFTTRVAAMRVGSAHLGQLSAGERPKSMKTQWSDNARVHLVVYNTPLRGVTEFDRILTARIVNNNNNLTHPNLTSDSVKERYTPAWIVPLMDF